MEKILFIGWDYQIYTHEILKELQLLGYDVTFYNVMSFSPTDKIRRFISKDWQSKVLHSMHQNIVKQEKSQNYDIVFILLPFFSLDCLQELRNDHTESKFILYLWDAANGYIKKGINISEYIRVFDKAFTFDRHDSIQYKIDYLPLFCIRRFQTLEHFTNTDNHVYTVGNLADFRRYKAIKLFDKYCKNKQIIFEWYLKSTIHKNIKIALKGDSLKHLHTASINNDAFINMMQRSSTVFDFANHTQNGYTMRLIENLCAGKKIITNNKNVLNESFYSPDRFFIFNNLCFDGIKDFLKEPLLEPNRKFGEFYLNSFVKKLISE